MLDLASSDAGQLRLSSEPLDLVEALRDLAEKRLVASPTDPSPNGWSGADFTAGMVGLTQWGYWFQAMAESDATKGSVVMLPAPTWGTEGRDPTMTATGWKEITFDDLIKGMEADVNQAIEDGIAATIR